MPSPLIHLFIKIRYQTFEIGLEFSRPNGISFIDYKQSFHNAFSAHTYIHYDSSSDIWMFLSHQDLMHFCSLCGIFLDSTWNTSPIQYSNFAAEHQFRRLDENIVTDVSSLAHIDNEVSMISYKKNYKFIFNQCLLYSDTHTLRSQSNICLATTTTSSTPGLEPSYLIHHL